MEKVTFLSIDFRGQGNATRYVFEAEEIKDTVGGQLEE